ncbi:DUF221-domain-containing protein [Neocallimastix californiae]|jgi:hypothetical protein|uniref:DUF221-domain-containing protein n=1 Tax=Neocallimastix californiae TaxID=1754190 RepID=A0A1Y2BGH5_9FUNG|nr:DUF221-domain-containing protein [Neocallimastix californiae]|eukprot:ORY33670.1 DUF221-domain-containing protein [Neocallimastix californiae]
MTEYTDNWDVQDSSINGVIMQLLMSAVMTIVFVTIFILLRNTSFGKPVYSPRILNIPEESPPFCEKAIDWLKSLFTFNNSFILDNISLDAVMLMNFYKMGIYVCLIGTIIICPILTTLDYYSHNEEFIVKSVNATNSTNENLSENTLNSRSITYGLLTPLNIEEDEEYYYYTFSKRQVEDGSNELTDPNLDSNDYNLTNGTELVATGLNMSIQVFSIANVPNDSSVLIAHSVCCYLYSFVVMFFLWKNYRLFTQYYQENIKKGGIIRTRAIKSEVLQAKTVMIRNLPINLQDRNTLIEWFNNLKVGKVEDIHVIREINQKLATAVKKRESTLYSLEKAYLSYKNNIDKNAQEKNFIQRFIEKKVLKKFPNALNNLFNPPSNADEEKDPEIQKKIQLRKLRPHHFAGTLYPLEGKFVDSISTYEENLIKYTKEIEELRKAEVDDKSRVFTAFVTFKDTRAAHIVSQLNLYTSDNRNTMLCAAAPKPTDLQWENLQSRVEKKQSMSFAIGVILFFMCIFYMVPVSFILAFTELENLQSISFINSFLEKLVKYDLIKTFFENILPNLIVNILLSLVPTIIYLLTKFEYLEAVSMREKSFLKKYFLFILFNVLFICTLSKTFWGVVRNAVDDPSSIISLLGEQLPKGANFFIVFIIYRIQAPASELAGIAGVVIGWLKKRFLCKTKRQIYDFEHATEPLNYGMVYPVPLLIFTIVSVYSCLSSFILIPGIFYFFFSYLVQKNNIIYKNVKKWENNGIYYNLIFNRIIFGLLVAQLTLIGMFSLKKNAALSTSLIPLVVITVIFTKLCHNSYADIHKNTPIDQFTEGQNFSKCKSNLLASTYENLTVEKSNAVARSDSLVSLSKEDLKSCMLDAIDNNLKDPSIMKKLMNRLESVMKSDKYNSNVDNNHLQVGNAKQMVKSNDLRETEDKKKLLTKEEKTPENNFGAPEYIYITAQKKRKSPQYTCLAESEVPKIPDYYLESNYNHPNYTCNLYTPWMPDGLDESLIEHINNDNKSNKKNPDSAVIDIHDDHDDNDKKKSESKKDNNDNGGGGDDNFPIIRIEEPETVEEKPKESEKVEEKPEENQTSNDSGDDDDDFHDSKGELPLVAEPEEIKENLEYESDDNLYSSLPYTNDPNNPNSPNSPNNPTPQINNEESDKPTKRETIYLDT